METPVSQKRSLLPDVSQDVSQGTTIPMQSFDSASQSHSLKPQDSEEMADSNEATLNEQQELTTPLQVPQEPAAKISKEEEEKLK